ncbi:type I-C CRISPR-associated protein Cas5c [Thiocapsa sp. UBA6158]|uniref:type I-C CRISPR-associated protein Cas5c n=1 Tax=Thiocapsa sp. UBA6158 TaxID=1947692 RepID=UPI0025F73D4A|nr:type I-C CRISPR-associated protein Cas5c [Thiocapsa sp. UBA6158]
MRILVTGAYACFTRPELSVERYTYDAITPSAAVGLIESVYWKPAVAWVIDQITVLNPIRYAQIRRNELAIAAPANLRSVDISRKGVRMQRRSTVLRDVAYVIDFHAVATGKESSEDAAAGVDVVGKHLSILQRRLERGQHFKQPVLGCREWPADVQLIEAAPLSALTGERDLGIMLHSINRDTGSRAVWHAVMHNGVIEVPQLGSPELIIERRAVA